VVHSTGAEGGPGRHDANDGAQAARRGRSIVRTPKLAWNTRAGARRASSEPRSRSGRRPTRLLAAVLATSILPLVLLATPASAAPLFEDGFESGTMSSWTSSTGIVVQPGDAHAGTQAARATSNASASWASKTLASGQSEIFTRVWFKVLSQSTNIFLLKVRSTTNAIISSLGVNTSNRLLWRNDVLNANSSSATTVSPGAWHELQMRTFVNGASSVAEVWLDGAKVTDLGGTTDLGTTPVGRLQIGDNASRTYDVLFDDVAADTAFIGGTTPGDTTPPSTPTGLAVAGTPTATRVDLTWNRPPEADTAGYTVYRNGAQLATVTGASNTSYSDTSVSASTTYSYTVDAFDGASPPNHSSQSTPAVQVTTPAGGGGTGDPVIAAAGDIACDPAETQFKGGNGNATKCHAKKTAAVLTNLQATTDLKAILAVGDTQYVCGGLQAYNQSYGPAWGQPALKAITHPVPGEQEYLTSGGTDCSATPGGGYFSYFGSAAGDPTKGYYSFDVGAWHIIALNSVCGQVPCDVASAQYQFLQADLAAHPATCTLAYWHHPRFASSNGGGTKSVAPFWDLLYAAGAEIALGGNQHVYERFAPQTPSRVASANGIRAFTVGTGGRSHGKFGTIQANSEVRDNTSYGVLKLTLHATSYDWQFVPVAGATFTDSGSGTCH
jgi:acid phosphatase type 7